MRLIVGVLIIVASVLMLLAIDIPLIAKTALYFAAVVIVAKYWFSTEGRRVPAPVVAIVSVCALASFAILVFRYMTQS